MAERMDVWAYLSKSEPHLTNSTSGPGAAPILSSPGADQRADQCCLVGGFGSPLPAPHQCAFPEAGLWCHLPHVIMRMPLSQSRVELPLRRKGEVRNQKCIIFRLYMLMKRCVNSAPFQKLVTLGSKLSFNKSEKHSIQKAYLLNEQHKNSEIKQ